MAGGAATLAGDSRLAIAGYGSHGALDVTFGSAGTVLLEVPGTTDAEVRKLIELPDHSILAIAGATDIMTKRPLLLIVHLSADGTIDSTFGGGGHLMRHSVPVANCNRTCPPYDFGTPTDAVLQRAPKVTRVVVALAAADRSPVPDYPREIGARRPQFTLLGLDVHGHADSAFGRAGRVLIDFNTAARANRVAALPDGRLTVAGSAAERFAVAGLRGNGRIDRSVGGRGRSCLSAPTGSYPHAATGLVALADGSSIVAGWAPADQVWAGGGANETALIGKVRARFKQSVTCFDLGISTNYRRIKAALILNARLRLGLQITRETELHSRKLGTVDFGSREPGLATIYWNGRVHGRRLSRGCYAATLVQLDRHRLVKRAIATRSFAVRRSSASCYVDSAHLS